MTTPITKEQLRRIIESADDVLSAQAGTNEDVHPESDDMIRLWDYLNDVAAPPAVVKQLAENALAAMDAEPVAWVCAHGDEIEYNGHNQFSGGRQGLPLYTAPPAPVVPDECPAEIRELMASHSDDLFNDEDAQEIWNACRAAMLQGKVEPVSQRNELSDWQAEAEKMAELHGCSFVVFRKGEAPQCADPSKVVISFTDAGLGHDSAAPLHERK